MSRLECDLSAPVTEWLRSRGMTVWAEVPYRSSNIDLVGRAGGVVIAVELKQSLSWGVVQQASSAAMFADEAWAGVFGRPKTASLARAQKAMVGVLALIDGRIEIIAQPTHGDHWGTHTHYRPMVERYLDRMAPWGTGGVRHAKGDGPRQRLVPAVRAFVEANPDADWKTIYRSVPNHYASARSMQGAIGMALSKELQPTTPPGGEGAGR